MTVAPFTRVCYLFEIRRPPAPLERGPLGLEGVHVREQAEPAQFAVEIPADGLPACGRSVRSGVKFREEESFSANRAEEVGFCSARNLTRERIPVLGVGLVVARKAQNLVQH